MRTRTNTATIAIAAVIALPLLVDAGYDSFPLSTYPMFARDRDRVVAVSTVVARDGDHTVRLTSHIIGGTEEPMLAAETVAIAVRAGEADALCGEVAARAANAGIDGTLEVVTEHYDTRAWFDGEHEPLERAVHASCEAPS